MQFPEYWLLNEIAEGDRMHIEFQHFNKEETTHFNYFLLLKHVVAELTLSSDITINKSVNHNYIHNIFLKYKN